MFALVEGVYDRQITCVSLLDKVCEEQCGVANDAGSPRLLMLTALEDQPIIHVALRV